MKRRGASRRGVALVLAVVAFLGLALWRPWRGGLVDSSRSPTESLATAFRPLESPAAGYVGSESCQECHAGQHASWHASYHRTMTTVASPATVHGDFTQGPFEFDGRHYELQRRGDEFWAVMDDPDRKLVPGQPAATRIERRIELVTGSHHLQLYWYSIGRTRVLGLLPIHFFKEERQWLPTGATMLRPHDGSFQSDTGRWNIRCLQCHTTHGRTRPVPDGMDTQVGEFGISCEACHGPAEDHVTLRRGNRAPGPLADDPIVNPRRLSPAKSAQICGLCHSYSRSLTPEHERREMDEGFHYRPGGELADSLLVERRDQATRTHLREAGLDPDRHFEERFWSDGMVRVAGREFNGLIESACHVRGEMTCLSCHAMHKKDDDPRSLEAWRISQVKPRMETDDACTQCHQAERYATSAHTHHAPDSHGSRCYDCHLPHTTFGILRAMRSHQIEVPRVATSVEHGRPNGCNLCHQDKSLDWTAGHLEAWYGQARPALTEDQKQVAAGALWTLTGDAGQRAIVAWNMGWAPARAASGDDWMVPYLAQLLEDDYEAVRMVAYRALRRIPGYEDVRYEVTGPRAERSRTADEVRKRWREAERPATPASAAVLLDANGALREDEFARLLKKRNRRAVSLLE